MVGHLFIFDIDGTLASFGGITGKAFNRTFQELHGQPGPWGKVLPHGRTDRMILRECFAVAGVDGDFDVHFRIFIESYLCNLREAFQTTTGARVLPGVIELLNRLDADSSAFLALGTGNVERAARMKLEHVGLNPFFPVGGFGDDAEERKEAIADAVRNATLHYQRSFAPELSWVIGDTPYDIEAGRALGLRTLAVATGGLHTIDDLRYAAPDVVLENLSDTERVLRAIELEK